MFTGLVEEIGSIQSVQKSVKGAKLMIQAHKVLQDVSIGDSIAINGICLTVTTFSSEGFTADVMGETMDKTNLKYLQSGSKVNLERALRVGDRLGGHFVSGHIDGVGTIQNYEKEDNAVWITISAPTELLKYMIYKGSITVDGVSLTVASVSQEGFKISIIPHTKESTTLIDKKIGDKVNLECDMIGKYIERFMGFTQETDKKQKIDVDFLSQHGFL